MVERITITEGPGMWLATSDDPEVVDLFGTATLPTPFTLRMPATLVVERISELNPGAVIDLVTS